MDRFPTPNVAVSRSRPRGGGAFARSLVRLAALTCLAVLAGNRSPAFAVPSPAAPGPRPTAPLAGALPPAHASPSTYQVFDLDPAGVLLLGSAFRINENGTAAGVGMPPGAVAGLPVRFDPGGAVVLPLQPGHEAGSAYDVSETGIVTGESDLVQQVGQFTFVTPFATTWVQGQAQDLQSQVTGGASLTLFEARRINEQGQIAGVGRDPSIPALHAFLFDAGWVTDLGSLAPAGNSEPIDMNEQGQIVGIATAAAGFDHAFLWSGGALVDLHDPVAIPGRISAARAINESGVIAGGADFVADFIDFETAAVWDHGTITNLGTLAGSQSYARDINEHGTIVGTSTWAGSGVHAFLYRPGGPLQDLNDLIPPGSGWTLANAWDITNDGRIAGEGFLGGALRPFLLVPDGCGGFTVYGAGCPGSGGYTPALWGEGCATAGGQVSFAITNGLGASPGALLFGTGTGVLPLKPGCDLQNLPLLGATLPLVLGGGGAGAGTFSWQATLPPAIPPLSLQLQAVLLDPGAPGGLTVTNPLAMDVE